MPAGEANNSELVGWGEVTFSVIDKELAKVEITSISSPLQVGQVPSCTIKAANVKYVLVSVSSNDGIALSGDKFTKIRSVTDEEITVTFDDLTELEPGNYTISASGFDSIDDALSSSVAAKASDAKSFVVEEAKKGTITLDDINSIQENERPAVSGAASGIEYVRINLEQNGVPYIGDGSGYSAIVSVNSLASPSSQSQCVCPFISIGRSQSRSLINS